jgi:hypothetical protein
MQQYGNIAVPQWYSLKQYYAQESFKFIAFEIYMKLVIEDLL